MPEKLTPQEHEMLSESPADAPYLMDEGEGADAEDAPEGVVEGQGD